MTKLIILIAALLLGCNAKYPIDGKINNDDKNVVEVNENKKKDVLIFDNKDKSNKTNKYTINQKIGQLLCVGVEQVNFDDELKQFIDKYQPGAFILFKRNIKNANQLKALNNEIKNYYKENNYIHPFIFVDQEGGKVDRLKSVYKPMNSANWYYNNSDAKTYVRDLNIRMSEFNFDSPLCPVLDVNSSNSKGAIGDRSFNNDYNNVSKFASVLLKEFKNTEMISVAKHFPGHGATTVDSHQDLPIINKSYDELTKTDMIPFINNINNIDGVMIAHILIPSYDKNPASLSDKWMKTLRDAGFKGLILSDDLTMNALKKYGDIRTRFMKFINAGGDMGLVCHYIENVESIFNELKSLDEKRIDESFERIIKLKNEKIKAE